MKDWTEAADLRLELLKEGVELPDEMFHWFKIMLMGAKKHGANNWLNKDGTKSDHDSMHNSMFHHLADSYAGCREDHESGYDPLLHLATRALMCYTRKRKKLDE